MLFIKDVTDTIVAKLIDIGIICVSFGRNKIPWMENFFKSKNCWN